jgi:GNAT superfamily N-acetyltransferase/heme-degrading monooxygenase HmoA
MDVRETGMMLKSRRHRPPLSAAIFPPAISNRPVFTSTFTFYKGAYDADFHALDNAIAEVAKAIPGYVGEESWENPGSGLITNVYYWESMEALRRLMAHPLHLEAKKQQTRWLKGYQVVIGEVVSMYGNLDIHPLVGRQAASARQHELGHGHGHGHGLGVPADAVAAALAQGELHISTKKSDLDIDLIHAFLANESSWARGISRRIVERSIEHSLCFGGFVDGRQVAFARVISDFSTFANLVDVFVLPAHRGQGVSKRLMEAVMSHADLQGLRRFTLATGDAHGLYATYGFTPPLKPNSLMERYFPGLYESPAGEPASG